MIKIIVIDSDKNIAEKIKKIITSVSMNFDLNISVEHYQKFNEKLRNEIENVDCKKIYILDVELDNDMSGISVAELIRKEDWSSEIIFVTNHDKMFETVFRTIPDVFDFIEKFHNFENKLTFDIERIFNKNFDHGMLKYKSRSLSLRIFYCSILYIYRDTVTRKLIIVTKNNHFSINLSLDEMMKLLDRSFVIVHRACIVNINAVNEFNWIDNHFTLVTGEKINMLSKNYKDKIEKLLE